MALKAKKALPKVGKKSPKIFWRARNIENTAQEARPTAKQLCMSQELVEAKTSVCLVSC
jgi:hypothetical protein